MSMGGPTHRSPRLVSLPARLVIFVDNRHYVPIIGLNLYCFFPRDDWKESSDVSMAHLPNPDEQARRRAVELGRSGHLGVLDELLRLTRHRRPTVRRAAVSALGKLTERGDVSSAVPRLCEMARDRHPQVRQYAMKALGKTHGRPVQVGLLRLIC